MTHKHTFLPLTICTAVFLLLMAACTPGPATGETPIVDLAGTEWVLAQHGPADAPRSPITGHAPTLNFETDNLGGNASCNQYGGDYRIDGDRLIIGEIFQTVMACMDTAVMDQESAYRADLGLVHSFTRDGDHLVLFYEGGELRFNRQYPPKDESLEGTPWQLTAFANGGVVHSLIEGSEVTAMFQEGQIRGNASCNQYFAAYRLDGDRLEVGDIGATKMGCEALIMKQEQTFMNALRTAQSYEINGRRLTLLHPGGALIFIAG
jgi:heat shock protein HslJ